MSHQDYSGDLVIALSSISMSIGPY